MSDVISKDDCIIVTALMSIDNESICVYCTPVKGSYYVVDYLNTKAVVDR